MIDSPLHKCHWFRLYCSSHLHGILQRQVAVPMACDCLTAAPMGTIPAAKFIPRKPRTSRGCRRWWSGSCSSWAGTLFLNRRGNINLLQQAPSIHFEPPQNKLMLINKRLPTEKRLSSPSGAHVVSALRHVSHQVAKIERKVSSTHQCHRDMQPSTACKVKLALSLLCYVFIHDYCWTQRLQL